MSEPQRQAPVILSAGALMIGVTSHAWWTFDLGLASARVGLRELELCDGAICITGDLASRGGFAVASSITCFVGVIAALAMVATAGLRAWTGLEQAAVARAAITAASVVAVATVLTLSTFDPRLAPLGDHSLSWAPWLTLGGAGLGIYGVMAGHRADHSLRGVAPIQSVPAASLPAAGQPPRPLGHSGLGLRFVVATGQLDDDGLTVQLEAGGERRLAWREIASVVARRLPPEPPFDQALMVDLVPAGAAPVRLLGASMAGFPALPGGGAGSPRDHLRRLVALIGERNRGCTIEPASAGFFAGRGEAPLIGDRRQLDDYDARYRG